MYNRQEVKRFAANSFSAAYWPLVGVCFLLPLLASIAGGLGAGVLALLVQGPLTVGLNMYCLRRWRGEDPTLDSAFVDGFGNYGHVLGGYLWMVLFTALWSLLFVIPGIVKAYAYAMTSYILGDCKQVSATDALKLSKRMMKGHKWELFVLHLSFLGWDILNALTAGILGIFYVAPYKNMSFAGYYALRKEQALAEGIITQEELMGAPIA